MDSCRKQAIDTQNARSRPSVSVIAIFQQLLNRFLLSTESTQQRDNKYVVTCGV
jgi:hypothetical protein